VLDRDGEPPLPHENGLKDTVLVDDPGSAVRVIAAFTDFADPQHPYMYHCHILEHEDAGMMGQFLVV
jgi:FtsP/CotA-like multicopper oxidase with cupredoxin domain